MVERVESLSEAVRQLRQFDLEHALLIERAERGEPGA